MNNNYFSVGFHIKKKKKNTLEVKKILTYFDSTKGK